MRSHKKSQAHSRRIIISANFGGFEHFRRISDCFGVSRLSRRVCPFYVQFLSFSWKIRKLLSFVWFFEVDLGR